MINFHKYTSSIPLLFEIYARILQMFVQRYRKSINLLKQEFIKNGFHVSSLSFGIPRNFHAQLKLNIDPSEK